MIIIAKKRKNIIIKKKLEVIKKYNPYKPSYTEPYTSCEGICSHGKCVNFKFALKVLRICPKKKYIKSKTPRK